MDDNSRMSNADMIRYCDEALAWEDFGPVDIFFFESVQKILQGKSNPFEAPEEVQDDLMGIERPVQDTELEPEYDKYADLYYDEDSDEEVPDFTAVKVEDTFPQAVFANGFFSEPQGYSSEVPENSDEDEKHEESAGGFILNL